MTCSGQHNMAPTYPSKFLPPTRCVLTATHLLSGPTSTPPHLLLFLPSSWSYLSQGYRFYLPPGLSSSVPAFPTLSVLTSTCPASFLVPPVLPTSTCPASFRSYLPRCPTCLSSRSYLSSHLPSPTTSLHYLLFLTSSRSYLSHLLLCSTTFLTYFPPGSTCPAFLSVLPPTCPTFPSGSYLLSVLPSPHYIFHSYLLLLFHLPSSLLLLHLLIFSLGTFSPFFPCQTTTRPSNHSFNLTALRPVFSPALTVPLLPHTTVHFFSVVLQVFPPSERRAFL